MTVNGVGFRGKVGGGLPDLGRTNAEGGGGEEWATMGSLTDEAIEARA